MRARARGSPRLLRVAESPLMPRCGRKSRYAWVRPKVPLRLGAAESPVTPGCGRKSRYAWVRPKVPLCLRAAAASAATVPRLGLRPARLAHLEAQDATATIPCPLERVAGLFGRLAEAPFQRTRRQRA